jgi:hypothetical protein
MKSLYSFYKRSTLAFSKSNFELNTTIDIIELNDCQKNDIEKDLLNPNVFKNLRRFIFSGTINSIHVDVFKPFKRLKKLQADSLYLENMLRRNGIEWIKRLNQDIKVNISNQKEISMNQIFNDDSKFARHLKKLLREDEEDRKLQKILDLSNYLDQQENFKVET